MDIRSTRFTMVALALVVASAGCGSDSPKSCTRDSDCAALQICVGPPEVTTGVCLAGERRDAGVATPQDGGAASDGGAVVADGGGKPSDGGEADAGVVVDA